MTACAIAGKYNFTSSGAAGGDATNPINIGDGFGGLGATIFATLTLSLGQQLYVVVGQKGDSFHGQELGDSDGEEHSPCAISIWVILYLIKKKCKARCLCSQKRDLVQCKKGHGTFNPIPKEDKYYMACLQVGNNYKGSCSAIYCS